MIVSDNMTHYRQSFTRPPRSTTHALSHFLLVLILAFIHSLAFAQQPPSFVTQPTNQTVMAGTTANLVVAVTGTGPFAFQWRFNGTNLPTIITAFAGKLPGGYSGDGGSATNAELFGTLGVSVDSLGNLFIADVWNNRVRKVDTNGIITTVAGNGVIPYSTNGDATGGFSGDGGPATNAELNWPEGLVVDAAGNIFIADYNNSRVRRVDTNGIITTFAEGPHPEDVTMDASGNLFFPDEGINRVFKVDTTGVLTAFAGTGRADYGGDGGPATNAGLSAPFGVALDRFGNLFIADAEHSRIRKVDTNGIITTVAGNGFQPTVGGGAYSGDGGPATNAALYNPLAVAVDGVGNLYIDDTSNYRIRKVDTHGIITTIAGNGVQGFSGDGGPSTEAKIFYSAGVAVDAFGNVFFGDDNARVREIVAQTPIFTVHNVDSNSVGTYDVVVMSPYGSTTSSAAVLTLNAPLKVQATLAATNIMILQLAGTPGQTYILQCASSLAVPINWQPVFTNVANSSGNWTFTNDFPATRCSLFYRIKQP